MRKLKTFPVFISFISLLLIISMITGKHTEADENSEIMIVPDKMEILNQKDHEELRCIAKQDGMLVVVADNTRTMPVLSAADSTDSN